MKKLCLCLIFLSLISICFAKDEEKLWVGFVVGDLPAGSTVQFRIIGTNIFTVDSSTATNYIKKWIVPKTIKQGKYNLDVSSITLNFVIHGIYEFE